MEKRRKNGTGLHFLIFLMVWMDGVGGWFADKARLSD